MQRNAAAPALAKTETIAFFCFRGKCGRWRLRKAWEAWVGPCTQICMENEEMKETTDTAAFYTQIHYRVLYLTVAS
jgi:hypothetical protein